MSDGRNFTNSAKPSGNFTLTEDKRCQERETEREAESEKDLIETLESELSCVRGAVGRTCCKPEATVETHNGATS